MLMFRMSRFMDLRNKVLKSGIEKTEYGGQCSTMQKKGAQESTE